MLVPRSISFGGHSIKSIGEGGVIVPLRYQRGVGHFGVDGSGGTSLILVPVARSIRESVFLGYGLD